ncbi:MAG: right-handed parallel beta-helix repeat-containing protein [Elusimicrobia bacterium]|nr:right-handed parallel beta-helix repeat-containing protein [Elusimicrobiota bacterium]
MLSLKTYTHIGRSFAAAGLCIAAQLLAGVSAATPLPTWPLCGGPVPCYVNSGGYSTIQSAVDALPASIDYSAHIYLGDETGDPVYNETVTVAGKEITGAGSITIAANPARASNLAYPTVTGGFLIKTPAVTLSHIRISPTDAITYGVMVSSPFVTLSYVTINDPNGYYINEEDGGAGVYFGAQSGSNTLTNCTIRTGGADAISDQGFGYNAITGHGNNYTYPWNHIYDIYAGNDGIVIGAASSGNTITAMSIQSSGDGVGIRDSGAGGNTITGNGNPYNYGYGTDNGVYDILSSSDGIVLSGASQGNTINYITIRAYGAGIRDFGGGGNHILGNDSSGNNYYYHTYDIYSYGGDGISISGGSYNNTISSVIISAAGAGIRDSGGGSNVITGNGSRPNYDVYDIFSNGDGVVISGASHNNTINNITIEAHADGIRDSGYGGNHINGNTPYSYYRNISTRYGNGIVISSSSANNYISSMSVFGNSNGIWDSGRGDTITLSDIAGDSDGVHFDEYSSSDSLILNTSIFGYGRGFYSDGHYNSATLRSGGNIRGYQTAGVFFDRHGVGNSLSGGGSAYSDYGSGALFYGDTGSSADGVSFSGLRAVEIAGASSTTITNSNLSTDYEAGFGLYAVNSDSLTFSGNSVTGGVDGLGVWLEYRKALAITMTNNSVSGSDTGMVIYSSQPYASVFNISDLRFNDSMPAMATAIDFWGSQVLTAAFEDVEFNSANILYNVIAYYNVSGSLRKSIRWFEKNIGL